MSNVREIRPTPTMPAPPQHPAPPSGGATALQPSITDVLMSPEDRVELSSGYVDPDAAEKSGQDVGTRVGGSTGGVVGLVAGAEGAAILTAPAGLAVGAAVGYYAGGFVGRAMADTANTAEVIWNWATGRK